MLMQYFSAVCPMVGECWYPLRGGPRSVAGRMTVWSMVAL